jgi:hypothetical protein
MSDYSELYFSNAIKHPPEDGELDETNSPYLLAAYCIPILWIALYEVSDAKNMTESGDEEWHYYCKPPKSAATLLNSRKGLLLSLIPNLKKEWFEQFHLFILNSNFKYVHLDIQQLGASTLQEPVAWNKEFERMINIFNQNNILSEPNVLNTPNLYIEDEKPKRKKSNFFTKLFSGNKQRPAVEENETIKTGWMMYQLRFRIHLTDDQYKNESWVYCGGSGTDELQPWE